MHRATPCWVRGGKVEEITWIGHDVLIWCNDLYIVFFHVTKRREILRWCWNVETGDGARCVSGHMFASVFAFAERSLNPRILVYAYPSMKRISECSRECESGYQTIAFTSHTYLVSLGSYPNFPLIVWNWRTGQKLALVDTSMHDEVGQKLKLTSTGRMVIGQLGKSNGQLITWELDIVNELVFLKDHEVQLPQNGYIHGIDWHPDEKKPLLAITDLIGNVYLSNYDGTDMRCIVILQHCGICEEIELPAVCWFRGGIILRTTFCEIRYFRRKSRTDDWYKQWYVKSVYSPDILVAHPSRIHWLFYYTLEGYLMQMLFPDERKESPPMIYKHEYFGSMYRFVDFVRPWCHHFVVTDDLKDLMILESYGGDEVARIELDMEGPVSDQAAHPDYPLIVVTSDHGEMVFVGIADPENPTILARLHPHSRPLDVVKFSHTGRFVIAADKQTGNCFCVNACRDEPWEVIAQVQTRRRLVDVMLYDGATEHGQYMKAFALFVKQDWWSPVGDEIYLYDVSHWPDHPLIDEPEDMPLFLPGFFDSICYVPGDESWLLIGAPYLERQLCVLRLKRNFRNIRVADAMLTGHHVRLPHIFTDRRWIVTCAYDGLVIVRDETVSTIVNVAMTHHRLSLGTVKAIVNHRGDMMIALGHDGSLVAVRFHASKTETEVSSPKAETKNAYPVDREYYERNKEKILADYASLDPAISAMLTQVTEVPTKVEKTWEELQQELKLQQLEKKHAEEKVAIIEDLAVLKAKVKDLIDINETLPEIQQLPISAFDLDRVGRDHTIKVAKDEREEVRLQLEFKCESMSKVAMWIKQTFWDTQVVLGRSVFSFCGDIEVTNYPTLPEDPYFKYELHWAEFQHETAHNLLSGDTFTSWHVYTDEQLKEEVSKPVRVYHEEFRMELLEEEDRELAPEELEELRAYDGMTTRRFVEQSQQYYPQMDSYGFQHATLENNYLMQDCSKLYAYFNKLFDDMYKTKQWEMNVIRDKNAKIYHIDSELKLMFNESVPRLPIDPQWNSKENVETIIRVRDDEVKAKPYVSPSLQKLLDKQAEEEERRRLEMLADDFWDRALLQMMDGVLEVRWEDTIKVDVRKPACMLEKPPEKFTAQDILAVKKYEEDVVHLQQERERYKRMLEADYIKISALRQEGIEKFDHKVNDLFQLKLQIDVAINQLKLRHVRGRLRNLQRIKDIKEADRKKREILEIQRYESTLENQVQQSREVYQNIFAQYDTLAHREKTIAKKFQHDFGAMSKSNRDILGHYFKRRPKTVLRNVTSYDLTNLGAYLVNNVKPTYMPSDCKEYLKVVENLDLRPARLPPSIDAAHWHHLVRLRRQKIDVEFRVRALQLNLAAIEHTINMFEENVEVCKSNTAEHYEWLKQAHNERVIREQNQEIQLVLKQGQVELATQGERRDSLNAVMIPNAEILNVNEHIRAAGTHKLDALKRTIDFRHKLEMVEWEHRCLRTRFRDLQDDMHFLREITVTRDMRIYLKRVAKGLRDDKTALQLEKQLENAKSSMEKALAMEMNKLENIREKIARVRKRNAELDRAIVDLNVKRWALEHQRDLEEETRQDEHAAKKLQLFKERTELIKKVQDNFVELLSLQTEHELLRMRTYPMLDFYETLDDRIDNVCQ